jgi:hypothetical protein
MAMQARREMREGDCSGREGEVSTRKKETAKANADKASRYATVSMVVSGETAVAAQTPYGDGETDAGEKVGEVLEEVEEGCPENALDNGEEVGRQKKREAEDEGAESREPLPVHDVEHDRGADDAEDQAGQFVWLYPLHDLLIGMMYISVAGESGIVQ